MNLYQSSQNMSSMNIVMCATSRITITIMDSHTNYSTNRSSPKSVTQYPILSHNSRPYTNEHPITFVTQVLLHLSCLRTCTFNLWNLPSCLSTVRRCSFSEVAILHSDRTSHLHNFCEYYTPLRQVIFRHSHVGAVNWKKPPCTFVLVHHITNSIRGWEELIACIIAAWINISEKLNIMY